MPVRALIFLALLGWPGLGQGQQPIAGGPAPAATSIHPSYGPLIHLRRLGGLALEPGSPPLRLDAYRAWAGLDADLEIWPPSVPAGSVWVMVQGRSSDTWLAYGPANHSQGRWIVPGVRLGEGIDQGRSYQLRAAILPEDLVPRSGHPVVGWLARALVFSPAVSISVEHRAVIPLQPAGAARLWISTIDHRTPAVLEPMATAAVVEVEGTLALPDDLATAAVSGESPQVYVVVRPAGGSGRRVFGPAGISGGTWRQAEVAVAEAGERHWLHYRLHAVLASEPPPGDLENDAAYSRWRHGARAASRSIDLTIRPRETPPSLPAPEIYLEAVKTAQGEILGDQQPVFVRTDDPIVEISGRVEGAPQGAYVWVLVHSPNTPVWETLGPALLEPPRWRLPLAAGSPRSPATGSRMMAILTTEAQLTGWVRYASWRRRALAVSESLSLQFVGAGETRDQGSAESSLRIRRVAGTVVGKAPAEAALSDDPSVQGSVTGLPADAGVWVASRPLKAQQWALSGPALIHGDHWYLPQARFADGTEATDRPGEFDLVALVATGEPPAPAIAQTDLRWLARATSPVVRIRDLDAKPRTRQRRTFTFWRALPMDLWLLPLAIVLLLVVLLTLASLFETFARLCLDLAQNVDRLSVYLHRQFAYLPRTRADASVIGLIVLAIALFAISVYLPVYTQVLATTFKLTEEVAKSLALMLVCATGLAGILIHLSLEFEDQERAGFLSNFLASLCMCVTPLLWFFQAVVYHHFYSQQLGSAGEASLPFAMALAAFFISFIETLAFFWATRLGLGVITWLCVHLLLAPLHLLARLAELAGKSRQPGDIHNKSEASP